MSEARRSEVCLLLLVVICGMPSTAAADAWGGLWGEMLWGPIARVPALGVVGTLVLASLVGATAFRVLRRRSSRAGVVMLASLLALPASVLAVSVPHLFFNGTAAQAEEVNENFSELATALSVTLPHTFVNGQVADAAQVNENFSALETGINTLEATLSQCESDLCIAGAKVCFESSDPLNDVFFGLTPDAALCSAFCATAPGCTVAECNSRCLVLAGLAESCL